MIAKAQIFEYNIAPKLHQEQLAKCLIQHPLLKEMKKVNSASNWIKVCSDGSYKVQLLFYL